MTKFFKALGATLLAAGLVVAGAATSAQAATLTVTLATSGQTIGTSGLNAWPITVSFTTVTTGATGFRIQSPNGWSAANINTICNDIIINSPNSDARTCSAYVGGTALVVSIQKTSGSYNSGVAFSVQFPQNTLNTGTNRTWIATTTTNSGNTMVDNGTADLPGGVTNSTVTFDANGGTGTTAAQTASTATALTANGFSRSGYTFAGWNTAANGSGTAYADGASYAFSSSTTLYAQWTATLANTGIDSTNGIMFLLGGLSLALIGAEMIMIARRKRSS
jgi:uncharacterized repeat protein (TIGR02543 family)/LPXTG-motif cell wall-anchored protein